MKTKHLSKYRHGSNKYGRILYTSPLPLQKKQSATMKYKNINFMVVIWDLETETSHPGESDPQESL